MNEWKTLRVLEDRGSVRITFDRPEAGNAFNATMLNEFHAALDWAEGRDASPLILLEGKDGWFCRGLDLSELLQSGASSAIEHSPQPYVSALRRLCRMPRVIVSVVDGQAAAGGLGFLAASDFVFATPRSRFHLPEALFGIVPACVAVFLSRKMSLHRIMQMSLTAEPVTAEQALADGLVDRIADDPADALRRLEIRVSRLTAATIGEVKEFFWNLGPIDQSREAQAMTLTSRLMGDDRVRAGIGRFLSQGRFPWE